MTDEQFESVEILLDKLSPMNSRQCTEMMHRVIDDCKHAGIQDVIDYADTHKAGVVLKAMAHMVVDKYPKVEDNS